MNENDLELLVSQFVTGFRRAFADVGKKGAADQAAVMEYLNRAIAEADKIRRENSSKQDEVAPSREFDERLDDYIHQIAETGTTPNTEKILRKVHVSRPTMALVAKQPQALIEHGITARIQDRIAAWKRREKKPPENEHQMYFESFYDQPEFRVMHKTILYVDPDTGRPERIPFEQSLKKHRQFVIAQRKADWKAAEAADAKLEPEVQRYGDIPALYLWENKLRDEKKSGSHRSA